MRFKPLDLDLDTLAMDHVEGRRQTDLNMDFAIAVAMAHPAPQHGVLQWLIP